MEEEAEAKERGIKVKSGNSRQPQQPDYEEFDLMQWLLSHLLLGVLLLFSLCLLFRPLRVRSASAQLCRRSIVKNTDCPVPAPVLRPSGLSVDLVSAEPTTPKDTIQEHREDSVPLLERTLELTISASMSSAPSRSEQPGGALAHVAAHIAAPPRLFVFLGCSAKT